MINLADYLTYENVLKTLPILAIIIGVPLKFNFRGKNYERMVTRAEKSLVQVIVPMVHELRQIINKKDANEQRALLETFFKKNSDTSSNIYLLNNFYYLDFYYNLEKKYLDHINQPTPIKGKRVWKTLLSLYSQMKIHYADVHFMLNADLRFYIDISKKNSFQAAAIKLGFWLYELLEFSSATMIIVSLLGLYGYFSGPGYVSQEVLFLILISTVITIWGWSILMMVNSSALIYRKPLRMTKKRKCELKKRLRLACLPWNQWLDQRYPDELVPLWVINLNDDRQYEIEAHGDQSNEV